MRKLLLMLTICLIFLVEAQAQTTVTVVDSTTAQPLEGASILVKGQSRPVFTNTEGSARLILHGDSLHLTIRLVGYQELMVNRKIQGGPLLFKLSPDWQQLREVVVSTGYRDVPLQQTTGSFVHLDQQQLNYRVGENLLNRLEDITPGLIFNRGKSAIGDQDISIRGQSSLFSANQPLIVVDGFPWNGQISDLNPNNVESITVLKDAAAASIYGVQAGNGVIVIQTKKGKFNSNPTWSFNSNVTLGEKADIFREPVMSSSDYINEEQKLFAKGYYRYTENAASKTALSPVIELLIAQRDGLVSAEAVQQQLSQWKQQDVRKDEQHYLQQQSLAQQYALNLSGGAVQHQYYFSLGYDHQLDQNVGNQNHRLNLLSNQKWQFLKGKMILDGTLSYTEQLYDNHNPGIIYWKPGEEVYPYAQLADTQGNPLTITKDYRQTYLQSIQGDGLLDWSYQPLAELNNQQFQTRSKSFRLNTQLLYRFKGGWKASLLYSRQQQHLDHQSLYGEDSYYVRNLVNTFTENTSGGLINHVPLGQILDQGLNDLESDQFRAQLEQGGISGDWEWHNFIGFEVQQAQTDIQAFRQYGYDPEHGGTVPVDYISSFPKYYYPANKSTIPFDNEQNQLADRTRSYYLNGAVLYQKQYALNLSARLDQSNLFGVAANQKGVPLYAVGAAWELSKAKFYHWSALPYLKLRLSYGYNGNVNRQVTAYTTARYFSSAPYTAYPYAQIQNPPNPDLKWERVKIVNFGVDFRTKGNRISGSVDLFQKRGLDLIGDSPYAPSSGVTSFTGNTASTSAKGFDISLQTRNVVHRHFQWETQWIVSVLKEKVTDYALTSSGTAYLSYGDGGFIYPLEGKPLYALYSLPWGGLDPMTGDPRGYLDGQLSENYNAIIAAASAAQLQYEGPARPTLFGAINNTFHFHQWTFAAHVSYRLGYYFRRPSVLYATVLSAKGGHGDYALRWQQPGDELTTQVPSEPNAISTNRDNLYRFADILVEKGDHIRLQDLKLGYDFHHLKWGQVQLYAYINNVGILWKATKSSLDPDYYYHPPVRTYALGLTLKF